MRFPDWKWEELIRAQAAAILVLTVALFCYEQRRPQFRVSLTQLEGRKHSPMELEAAREVVHRLPPLPAYYRRKVLFHQARFRRPYSPQMPRQWPSRTVPGKSLLALNQTDASAESSGRD